MTLEAPTGTLEGWSSAPFASGGITHEVFEKGDGPGVVLIPEIPGVTPEVLGLAEHLVASGFTVAVPSLFGVPGASPSNAKMMALVGRLCVSAEFRAFTRNAKRPVTEFLRGLASSLNARTPGSGVGVIGMCFTGGFALAAAIDDSVVGAVLSQPSVPFPVGPAHRSDPGMSQEEFARVTERASAGSVCALGLRFSEDRAIDPARFATLKNALGDAFEVITLDSGTGNPDGYSSGAHSVLTGEVRESPANSASAARDRVVAFMHERLTASSDTASA